MGESSRGFSFSDAISSSVGYNFPSLKLQTFFLSVQSSCCIRIRVHRAASSRGSRTGRELLNHGKLCFFRCTGCSAYPSGRRRGARETILLQHIANGVIIDSRTVQIAPDVQIAPGAVILAGTILRGHTIIGAGCIIGPNTLIEDSIVDEGTTVNASQVYGSHLGPHNNIGPFTHVRVNTVTDYGVHLGAYVETKNSNFARGNTVSHLTYIGDSDVGKYCNFGCGTVTCNYDGKDKFRTTIGTTASSAATPTLWPRSRWRRCYTAAGSTITQDVPAQALGIARERQTNLEGWLNRRWKLHRQEAEAGSRPEQVISFREGTLYEV